MIPQGHDTRTHSLSPKTGVSLLSRISIMIRHFCIAAYRWSLDNTFSPRWCPFKQLSPIICYSGVVTMQLVVISISVFIVQDIHQLRFLGVFNILLTAVISLNWGAGPVLLASLIGAPLQQLLVLFTAITPNPYLDTAGIVSCITIGLIISLSISRVKWENRQTERRFRQEREHLLAEQALTQAKALALTENQQRMEEFIGLASHEMRAPLTAIIGNIQVAGMCLEQIHERQESITLDPPVPAEHTTLHRHLQRAERHVWQLNRLVDELLDVALIQAHQLTLRLEPCNLSPIVQEAVEALHIAYPERIVHLTPDTPAPIMIIADQDRLNQVITNYLTNAHRYSPADQPILITLTQEEQSVRVNIRDQGPGIPPQEQEHIWERFYRIRGSETQPGAHVGLGVGLYLCHTIIEQHRGSVGVESAPGQGSDFWFTLPLDPASKPL